MNNPHIKTIRAWDWNRIKADATSNPQAEPDNDAIVGLCYLGTVFSLTPSGKFYAPWACSNLELCPACKGTGERRPHGRGRKRQRKKQRKQLEALRTSIARGFQSTGTRSPELIAKASKLYRAQPSRACGRCGGLGSEEAYQDELWTEAMELVSDEHGMFVTSGEGDPCDVFAGVRTYLCDDVGGR